LVWILAFIFHFLFYLCFTIFNVYFLFFSHGKSLI
jgi:hypothetical protein